MIYNIKRKVFVVGVFIASLFIVGMCEARVIKLELPRNIDTGSLDSIIDIIDDANSGDRVEMRTDGNGGYLYDTMKLLEAMGRAKPAVHIHCVVKDFAASASAIITSACTTFELSNNAFLLYHMPRMDYFYGYIVDVQTVDDVCPEARQQAINFAILMQQLGIHSYMTKQQWFDMLHGKDIVLTGEEMKHNLKLNRGQL